MQVEGNTIKITGYNHGSHFPSSKDEIFRFWVADGTSSAGPFQILGSVYGREPKFYGAGEVEGSILGRGTITLENNTKGIQRFLSGMMCNASIVTNFDPQPIQETLTGSLDNVRYVFRGNVQAQNKIELSNAIVFGNIKATSISLHNCIVVGMIGDQNTEKVEIRASTVMHYQAKQVTFFGPCTLLEGLGTSLDFPGQQPLVIPGYEGEDCDIRFYPLYRELPGFQLGNKTWISQENRSEEYQSAKIDFDKDVKEKVVEIDSKEEKYHMLSLGGRILDLSKIEKSIKHFRLMLQQGLEFFHYSPEHKAVVQQSWADNLTEDEQRIMKLLTSPITKHG